MKNSLFRIDSHSVTAEESHAAGFVVLPDLKEMMRRTGEEEPPEERGAESPGFSEKEGSVREEAESRQSELNAMEARIKQLRREAEETLRVAEKQAAELREKAEKEGYEAGAARAEQEARAQTEAAQKSLAGALERLASAEESLYAEMEEGVLDLALYIAEHIIKTEISGGKSAYKNMIREVLMGIRNQSNIVLKVGSDEYEQFFADAQDELGDVLKNSGIKVVQDISLQPGDCLVETEFGYIDAGILTQLKRLEYSMKQFGTGQ